MRHLDGRAGAYPLHDDEEPLLVEEPAPYVHRGQIVAARLLEDVEIESEAGTLYAGVGAYLIQYPDGRVSSVSQQELDSAYMRIAS